VHVLINLHLFQNIEGGKHFSVKFLVYITVILFTRKWKHFKRWRWLEEGSSYCYLKSCQVNRLWQ